MGRCWNTDAQEKITNTSGNKDNENPRRTKDNTMVADDLVVCGARP